MSMKRRVEALASVQTPSVPRAALRGRALAVVGGRPRSRRRTPCGSRVHAASVEGDDQVRADGAVYCEAVRDLDWREIRRSRYLQGDRALDQAQPRRYGHQEIAVSQRTRELD